MPRIRQTVILSACALCCATANAQFVQPAGELDPCDLDVNTQLFLVANLAGDPPSPLDPDHWNFFTFEGEAGQVIEFQVGRTDEELDPVLTLWQGDPSGVLLSSFSDFATSSDGSISVIGTLDDENPPATGSGPWGDPFGTFTLPATGTYFIIIAGNLSNPGGAPYGYALVATSLSTINNVTAATNHATIQDAIDNANNFDVIELGCGLIRESGIVVDRPVTIIGADAESTFINGGNNDRIFVVQDSADGASFEEFTISAGLTTGDGGGFSLRSGSQCAMRDLRISSCTANNGGAIDIQGGAAMQDTTLEAINCRFDSNDAVSNGGGGTGGALSSFFGNAIGATFVNCLFDSNTADGDGAVIVTDGAGKVVNMINCTLYNNSSSGSPRLIQTCCGGLLNIVNTIISANGSDDITDFGAGVSTIARSIFPFSTALTGVIETDLNIHSDPGFADPTFGDFRLTEESPAIDIADFQAYSDFSTSMLDYAHRSRLNDDPGLLNQGVGAIHILDIGAFEFQGASCRVDINGDGQVDAADLGILIGGFGTFCP